MESQQQYFQMPRAILSGNKSCAFGHLKQYYQSPKVLLSEVNGNAFRIWELCYPRIKALTQGMSSDESP